MKTSIWLLPLIFIIVHIGQPSLAQHHERINPDNLMELTSQLIISKDNPATRITSLEIVQDLIIVTYSVGWDDPSLYSCEVWNIPSQTRILYFLQADCVIDNHQTRLAVSGANGSIHLYQLPNLILENEVVIQQQLPIYKLRFSPDDSLLVAGLANTQTVIWDIANQTQVALLNTKYQHDMLVSESIWDIRFSPSGQYLIVENEYLVSVWETASFNKIFDFFNFSVSIMDYQFNEDETVLAMAGWQLVQAGSSGVVNLFDMELGKHSASISGVYAPLPNGTIPYVTHWTEAHQYPVQQVAFLDGTDYLIALSGDSVHIWNYRGAMRIGVGIEVIPEESNSFHLTGLQLENGGGLGDAHRTDFWHFTLTNDQTQLIFGDRYGNLYAWNIADLQNISMSNQVAHTAPIANIQLLPDEELLITMSHAEIIFWDVNLIEPLTIPENLSLLPSHIDQQLTDILLSDDMHYIAFSSSSQIHVWGIV